MIKENLKIQSDVTYELCYNDYTARKMFFDPIRLTCATLKKLLCCSFCKRHLDLYNLWRARLFHFQKVELQKVQLNASFSVVIKLEVHLKMIEIS